LWVVQGGYCGQKHSVFCTEILKTLWSALRLKEGGWRSGSSGRAPD
jgi:hypothetical protein